ncbi:hypothetical protein QUC32_03040 [Novosphingobium resinovorum]|uniref:DUF6894 family protein n=1 Tax=Novosphingobium TaxID=165696 RepID=UPI001B3C75EE|nr:MULTISPECIES: hypothetical protein [Novosphingobium]MBF7013807.1 hypothetical protein [Novosphingobium sp. HR1a]WJM25951.1 hypothetical protein QUC32_03040 [Novosphingobium resinovorum]
MARFFFHFFDGNVRFDDEQGVDLPSADHAYLEAFSAATAMWGDLLNGRTDPSGCAFEIANSAGLIINRVEFSELLDNCRPANAVRQPPQVLLAALADTHRRANAARAELATSLAQVRTSLAEANVLLSRLSVIQNSGRRRHRW